MCVIGCQWRLHCLYRQILQWLHTARKASMRRSTVQNSTVVIFLVLRKKVTPFYTNKDFWTIVFSSPLGEHHISDKSITLPTCLWNSAHTRNECIQSIKKTFAACAVIRYRLCGALVEVVKVHPEFRMINVVFLRWLGDTKQWDASIFITSPTAGPEHPRAPEYYSHREHLS